MTARVREKYLKSAAGKRWLRKYLDEQGGDTEFPAWLRHAGRESRTGYKASRDSERLFVLVAMRACSQ